MKLTTALGGIMKIGQGVFMKLVGFMVIAFMLPLLVSCSPKPEGAIVGKWGIIDGSQKIEFFKDGTLMAAKKSGGMVIGGQYTFVEKNRIKLKLDGLDPRDEEALMVVTVSISGQEMMLTMPDGHVSKYKREK
jgi:hypothetical protein